MEKQSKEKIVHPLESIILEIVNEAIRNSQVELTKAEIKSIVYELLPNIDELISVKIKQHFLEIGEYIVSKFKT
ncbi:MAG: hypothetical protein ACTSWJ_10965 [Candidatus Heimdallarchaeaceae archaeon]